MTATLESRTAGRTSGGDEIRGYILRAGDRTLELLTVGAAISRYWLPDGVGGSANVVLGYRDPEDYETGSAYFGAVIGRHANRLANGRFTLDGRTYELPLNHGRHHLHGGHRGFDKKIWKVEHEHAGVEPSLVLSCFSEDGEEGYPGNLKVTVTYTLLRRGGLRIDYRAVTDAPTIINLTNHTYFNLAGTGHILDHAVEIAAQAYLAVDAELIPTGEIRSVEGTPFDFRVCRTIGDHINRSDPQLIRAHGYDHCFVLDRRGEATRDELMQACVLHEPGSGRLLEVWTSEPGLQLYTGNFLDGSIVGADGSTYRKSAGLCLETQHFPDAPHHPGFPSTVLLPGEEFRSSTCFRFLLNGPALR